MENARAIILSVLEHIKTVLEHILVANMKILKKPLKRQAYNHHVQLFSINLLSVFGECGGTFEICTHDYDVCNDDKQKC